MVFFTAGTNEGYISSSERDAVRSRGLDPDSSRKINELELSCSHLMSIRANRTNTLTTSHAVCGMRTWKAPKIRAQVTHRISLMIS